MSSQKAILAAVYGAAIVVIVGSYKSSPCNEIYRNDKQIYVNSKILSLELAESLAEVTRGLGGRACISNNQAMLFDYKISGNGVHPVWMKDMRFPIDIVWINEDKQVVKIMPNVFPASYPESFVNTQPVRYVLELKSGQAKVLGIGLNSSLNL